MKKKMVFISLIIYWSAIFILTHIPVPHMISRIGCSDKTLHFFAYIILSFVLWPNIDSGKVNFKNRKVWYALAAVALYAVADEWLQGFVGRSPDIQDYLFDMAGATCGFVFLSIVPFWPATVVLISASIFFLNKFLQLNTRIPSLILLNICFWFFCYGMLTFAWIRCLAMFKPNLAGKTWLIYAFFVPAGFLAAMEIFSAVTYNRFKLIWAAAALVGIATTTVWNYTAKITCGQKVCTKGRLSGEAARN